MNATTQHIREQISRRDFVRGAATIGSGLALSLALPAMEGGPPRPQGPVAPRTPSAFVQIAADGTITIVTPAVEMGQGGHTGMPMIIMEELGGDWRKLAVQDAPAARIYNNPLFGQQSTVGSFSVRGWYTELRRIGAAAREMLVAAAAQEWNVPASECTVANSIITHRPSGRTRSFGSVAQRAAVLPVPQEPAVRKNTEFRLIGTSPARVDVPLKVDGSARFGIDVVLPDMLIGAVKTSPTLGGTLKSFDDSAARGMKGFHSTVALRDGVIVLAKTYWQAKSALDKVAVMYDAGKLAGVDSDKVSSLLRAGFAEPGAVVRNDGDTDTALAGASRVVEATYEVPYLAHACMEPMNCVARVTAEGCEVWCGTQTPQSAQAAAVAVLKIPAERVTVHTTYLGGGFGRRGEADFVTQAVTASKASGRAVKLIWSREEDIQHDFYRPAAAIRFRGGVDAAGKLTALDCRVVTSAAPSFGGPPNAGFYTGSLGDMAYAIPNLRVSGLNKDIGVRFGFWRSVNQSHNPFMLEGFLDEVAAATGKDPYQFRRSLLQHDKAKRQLAVLDMVADKAGWGARQPGHFYGISAFAAYGSYIGSVVDVTLKGKTVVLQRVVTVLDCGVAVHPDNIKAQLEGGMVYGLSAVLRGEITLKDGAVQQGNFHDYPLLTMAEMPRTECHIMPSSEAPGGVGEPGTAPIAPSLASAIFAATATRVRTLPLTRHDIEFATARS
jgi:isoquinoline 1-oxidoreductase beta subunit